MENYHHGQVIKEFRKNMGMTQAQLAEQWPKSARRGKGVGASISYIQEIEYGKKHIEDIYTLRKLCDILHIPYWRFGLSEYDPHHDPLAFPVSVFDECCLNELIQATWYIRLSMPADITEQKINILNSVFNELISRNPLLKQKKDFLRLYAQAKRLQSVLFAEKKNYDQALKSYFEMLEIVKETKDSTSLAMAYTRIGVELLRKGDEEAVDYLEIARDETFQTSRELASLCSAFLARGYATIGDEKRFIRSIDTAINLAHDMVGKPLVTKDYVFHSYSGILEEKSNGFILLGNGKEALKVLPEIEKNIEREQHAYLKMWLPLDYAQCYMLLGEVEESVQCLCQFYENIKQHKSQRVFSCIPKHLRQLDERGYSDVKSVRDFKGMIQVV